ncbi:MAG TPA: arginase family protein [Gemmatimonadaceae bacterium]|nr:arginase family protein [Gemmatimonadaceae bacterium]
MRAEIIVVPFDSGFREKRMGRGPNRLLELGLGERLQALGADVRIQHVEPPLDVFPSEIRMAHELHVAVAVAVSGALERQSFPLVLSGNCNVAVGVVAGMQMVRRSSPAVFWFDAHADFNTPETTIGGFLDGMAVSMIAGHCWRALIAQVPGFVPIPESQILMIGTRDIDPLEQRLLDASDIRVAMRPTNIGAEVDAIIAPMKSTDSYVHVDLDSLDASEGSANVFAAADGLARAELLDCVDAIGTRAPIVAATLSAYDPACDVDGRIGRIAMEVAERLFRHHQQSLAR